MAAVFEGEGELPPSVPTGLRLTDVIAAIRAINLPYSRASRWIGLSPWQGELDRGERDLRPWLSLRASVPELEAAIASWSSLSRAERTRWLERIAGVCPIGGTGADVCLRQHAGLAQAKDGAPVRRWRDQVLAAGQKAYDRHFGVQVPHRGARVEAGQAPGGGTRVTLFAFGVAKPLLDWVSEQVGIGWVFPGSIAIALQDSPRDIDGAVRVKWEAGALPHVNGVGGDTITMDANTARWLEQTQVTMIHEMGHVIGFPDCYVEFWDPAEPDGGAFVQYGLDPEDRMCALSGSTLDRHRQALLAGFSP